MTLAAQLERLWLESPTNAPDIRHVFDGKSTVTSEDILTVLRLDQEYRWKTGQPFLVEDYLKFFSWLPQDVNWRVELLLGEMDTRKKLECPPTITELRDRFPDLENNWKERRAKQEFGTVPDTIERTSTEASLLEAASEPPNDRRVLTSVGEGGRYAIQDLLGEGTFGTVYLGFDTKLQRQVAIKVPRQTQLKRSSKVKQYLEEARTVANLPHPNIVPVHDVGDDPSGPVYVVSQFINGGTLRARLNRQPWAPEEAIRLLLPIAHALHFAHERNLVHRDVKPENILIDNETGMPIVADFGLAVNLKEESQNHQFAGTPYYMSPEQARGEQRLDGRSDVFSMGVILYEMLTGKRPFRGDSLAAICQTVVSHHPAPPGQLVSGIPPELDIICLKAISKEPKDRYSAAGLADVLQEWLNHTQIADGESAPTPVMADHDTEEMGENSRTQVMAISDLPVHTHVPHQVWIPSAGRTGGDGKQPPILCVPSSNQAVAQSQKSWAAYLKMSPEVTNSVGMKFRLIPPGTFLMGSPSSEPHRFPNETIHRVTLTQPSLFGVYPVTQKEWTRVMGHNPSFNQSGLESSSGKHPVESVTWLECQEFLEHLRMYPISGWYFRFPTEAEWEFACRAGTDSAYAFGHHLTADHATCRSEPDMMFQRKAVSSGRTVPVGTHRPNALGLFDMHGNVAEWCEDWYDGSYDKSPDLRDPKGPKSGTARVARGGSWNSTAAFCRSAHRQFFDPDTRHAFVGCRIVASPSSELS